MHNSTVNMPKLYSTWLWWSSWTKQLCPSPARCHHMSAPATHWHLKKAPKDLNQIRLYGVLQMLHNPQLHADFPWDWLANRPQDVGRGWVDRNTDKLRKSSFRPEWKLLTWKQLLVACWFVAGSGKSNYCCVWSLGASGKSLRQCEQELTKQNITI